MRIHKPEGEMFFWVEYLSETEGLKRSNTYCSTVEEAEALCKKTRIQELEDAAKQKLLTNDVLSNLITGRTVTVPVAIDEWEAWARDAVRSPRTRENTLTTLRQWCRECGLKERLIGSITTKEINQWINGESSLKLGTRINKLSHIQSLFRYASIKKYVHVNPAELASIDYKKLNYSQKEVRHKKVFEDVDVEFLIENSDGQEPPSLTPGFFRAAIILGRDLGLRLGDICCLEWRCFNVPNNVVKVWMEKSNKWIEVPMPKRVKMLLNKITADNKYLFPNEQRMHANPDTRSTISGSFSRFFQRAGYDGYSFHSLRATLATTMASKGATMEEIAAALGHGNTKPTESYVHKPGSAIPSIR